MRSPRRWFWQDEYDGSSSPGWAIGMITVVLLIVGLGSYWLNDMHMYHYGLFGSQ